jgi:hypothetical protein
MYESEEIKMNCKPLISGAALIEIERSRYDELIAQEEELYRLKKALCEIEPYSSDINLIKTLFDITTENKESEETTNA